MWTEGTIRVGTSVFHYWVKHYEEPSTLRLRGRQSLQDHTAAKWLKRFSTSTVAWMYRRTDAETETALAILLKQYN